MQIIYIGTPEYVVPPLDAVLDTEHDLKLVITPPDVVRGRGQTEEAPPLKTAALERGLHVYQPESINSDRAVQRIAKEEPDLLIVASFGKILTDDVLGIPEKDAINIHPSLLPAFRGPAPVTHTLLAGERETGVTFFQMNEDVDQGPIIEQVRTDIDDNETTGELRQRLFELAAETLPDVLDQYARGTVEGREQSEEDATYAPMVSKEDGNIPWNESAEQVHNHVRAMQPWPGAFSWLNIDGRSDALRMNILQGERDASSDQEGNPEPGMIVGTDQEGLHVQTGEGVYVVSELQPENKSPMPARDFINGYQPEAGDQFVRTPDTS